MKDYKEVKTESNTPRELGTGAVRDIKDGKGRFDLLPPLAIKRLAKHFQNGAKKYKARNWEKGMETWEYMDSGLRHAFDVLAGKDDEDHLAAVVWNFLCLMETEERIDLNLLPKELDTLRNDTYEYFNKPKLLAEAEVKSFGGTISKQATKVTGDLFKKFKNKVKRK
jgi:hypothetical protein